MSVEERYYSKPGPIAPLALVDEWLGIWLMTQWQCYKVTHYEPIPRSRQFIQDFGGVAAGAWAATAPITTAAILQQRQTPPEAFQLRFYPLDDIEVLFYIGNADTRFMTARQTARADVFTMQVDPFLHSTEVVVLTNSNPFLNIFNPTAVALVQSRVQFFGYRYALDKESHKTFHTGAEARKALGPITLAASGGF
jgi:hypothetical protein